MKEKILSVLKKVKNLKLLFGSKKQFLLILTAILLALVLYRFKGVIVAASVNGAPISRLAVLRELEKEGGKSVLNTLITNALILQEAKKQNVTVSPQEISDQVTKISDNLKKQGQDLDNALAMQGMTRSDLDTQIKLQILVQKMAASGITITDTEAQDYFKQNSSSYPKGTKFEDVKDQIKQDLTQQKASEAINTWITSLKTKAKINYFVNY